MSAQDIDHLLAERYAFLSEDVPCTLREILFASVRQMLEELDALDRDHPVWSLLAVQTVNASRLDRFVGWQLWNGLAGEAADWTIVAHDLAAGSCVSTEAWGRLAKSSAA